MLFIIIGIILVILGIVVIFKFQSYCGIVGIALFAMFISLGISSISGYEKPFVESQYDLKPIYEPNIYIIEDRNGAVICKHDLIDNSTGEIKTDDRYMYKENVEIVITAKGTKPVMKKYIEKAKKTIWTFAVDCDKIKYVFYVPEESIDRWQNMHVN